MSPRSLRFRYEAARADGVRVRGVIDAGSEPDATAVLSGRGLYPLSFAPVVDSRMGWLSAPSLRDQAIVFQGLSALVEAGVPLERALAATQAVARARLREPLNRVTERVRQGGSLSSALAAEHAMSPGAIGLVQAGERGVGLGIGLAQAAKELELEADSVARVRTALTYPALLSVVGSLSVALIVLYVIPRFAVMLGDLNQELPPATSFLLGTTALLREYGLFLGTAFTVAAVIAVRRTRADLARWHDWLLRLPLIGPLRLSLATARSGRTLAALLATGTPALQSLRTTAEATSDAAIAQRLRRAADHVAEGVSLSAALSNTRAVTDAALQLTSVGEGSGRLPALLAKAADLEQAGAERRLQALVALLEPTLIVAFAALVAFVAAALLQAVYAVRP